MYQRKAATMATLVKVNHSNRLDVVAMVAVSPVSETLNNQSIFSHQRKAATMATMATLDKVNNSNRLNMVAMVAASPIS